MIVVLDASSLILLEKTGLLEKLAKRTTMRIPKEVEREATAKGTQKSVPDAFRIKGKIEQELIKVESIKNLQASRFFQDAFNIGKGESEAITLFKEIHADILATDDRLAINACKALHIPFATSIAFVIESYETGKVTKDEASQMIQILADQGRYKAEIIFNALKKIGGADND